MPVVVFIDYYIYLFLFILPSFLVYLGVCFLTHFLNKLLISEIKAAKGNQHAECLGEKCYWFFSSQIFQKTKADKTAINL